ncbi:MAG: hypothetical protein JXA64_11400 [Candidatus Fermentibacteraceae bacterium]|nr:hypothetical protein [Candidatus Fermentibacteraceae bacterium]
MSKDELMREELEHYWKEKEKVRQLVGQIGGNQNSRKHLILNIVFLVVVGLLFLIDLCRHIFDLRITGFPAILSIEIAILLVSLKVIWMIHTKTKVDHFQFWILNSIEFQMNNMARRVRKIEKLVESSEDHVPDE